jgi:hypothetical protein
MLRGLGARMDSRALQRCRQWPLAAARRLHGVGGAAPPAAAPRRQQHAAPPRAAAAPPAAARGLCSGAATAAPPPLARVSVRALAAPGDSAAAAAAAGLPFALSRPWRPLRYPWVRRLSGVRPSDMEVEVDAMLEGAPLPGGSAGARAALEELLRAAQADCAAAVPLALAAKKARAPRWPLPALASVSLVLCDDPYIRELNAAHRGKDAPTDVLSFEVPDEPGELPPPVKLLGDLVVSLDTAARQAEERGCGRGGGGGRGRRGCGAAQQALTTRYRGSRRQPARGACPATPTHPHRHAPMPRPTPAPGTRCATRCASCWCTAASTWWGLTTSRAAPTWTTWRQQRRASWRRWAGRGRA